MPLLVIHMSSIYVIAFSLEAFGNLIFITIILLHPTVSIPIAYLVDSIRHSLHQALQKCGCNFLDVDYQPSNFLSKLLKNSMTFSMTLYLAFTTSTQYFLFHQWMVTREVLVANGYASIKPRNAFTNGDLNICQTAGTDHNEMKINPLNLLTNLDSETKSALLYSPALIMILYHFVESLVAAAFNVSHSKSALIFLLGKTKSDSGENIKEIELHHMQESQPLNPEVPKQNVDNDTSDDDINYDGDVKQRIRNYGNEHFNAEIAENDERKKGPVNMGRFSYSE